MKIQIVIDGSRLAATLDDTELARDFATLLPLTLTLEDYASAEKIAMLPRRLAMGTAPPGADSSPGDVMYYEPWGNLALFYRSGPFAAGLTRLGRIDANIGILERGGTLHTIIEKVTGGTP